MVYISYFYLHVQCGLVYNSVAHHPSMVTKNVITDATEHEGTKFESNLRVRFCL